MIKDFLSNNPKFNTQKGITLLALVITIIILIILAGIAIASLTGDNGLFARAREARDKTEEASDKEKIGLAILEAQIGEDGYQKLEIKNLQKAINAYFSGRNIVTLDNGDKTFTVSCLDTLKDYKITADGIEDGIDWNKIMTNAKVPVSQNEERNEGVIGLGTDGNPVNMDLWNYTLLDDGTFGLNIKEVFNNKEIGGTSETDIHSAGYNGSFINGTIQGTIPQYISTDNGKTFTPVTNLYMTFYECNELEKMPAIPTTVKVLFNTFLDCANLQYVLELPSSVENMRATYARCTKLEITPQIPLNVTNMQQTFLLTAISIAPEIPDKVENMQSTFQGTKIIEAPQIPTSVVNMNTTFYSCSLLTTASEIPSNVRTIQNTYNNCPKLNGKIEINANIPIEDTSAYAGCLNASCQEEQISLKVYGTCPAIANIIKNAIASGTKIVL